MILAIDIGNTNITCGLYNGDSIIKRFRILSDKEHTVQDFNDFFKKELGDTRLEGAIIGSVVDELNNRVQYSILALYGVKAHILSHKSNMPIILNPETAHLVGADRIANAVRGYNLYKKSVIVVDFGTATTFDIVNSKGEFLGGLIAPGIETQLNSLCQSTSKLPDIKAKEIGTNIGTSTEEAILAGVIRGSACMIDGMISKTIEELEEKEPVIIATGGYYELITKYMKTSVVAIPDLTLDGLRDLFLINKPIQPIFK